MQWHGKNNNRIFFSSPISLLLLLLLITEIRPDRTATGVLTLSAAASVLFSHKKSNSGRHRCV